MNFFQSVSANDISWMVIVFLIWAAVDFAIVKRVDKKKTKQVEAKRFENRKPTILY